MVGDQISDEMVEKVAEAEYEHDEGSTPGGWYKTWADVEKNTYWDYVHRARAGIAVALPLLRAQWEAEMSECDESASVTLPQFFADQPELPPVPCVRKPLGHPLPHRAADGMEWWPIAEESTPADGVTREQWAVRNLRSGGSIVRWSEADARDDLARANQRDPYGPDPDPHDLVHRWWTEYADGSVAGTPWTVVDDDPSDRVQTADALVALGQEPTTDTIPTEEPR